MISLKECVIPVSFAKDINDLEQCSLDQRIGFISNTYDLLRRAVSQVDEKKIALKFVPDAQKGVIIEQYSYSDLLFQVTQMINMFVDFKVNKNDIITLLLPNTPKTFMLHIAAETVAISCPISPFLSSIDLAHLLNISKSRVLITTPDLLEKLSHTNSLKQFCFIFILNPNKSLAENQYDFDVYKNYPGIRLNLSTLPTSETVCAMVHTNAATEPPKFIQLTQLSKIYSAWAAACCCDYQSNDRILGVMSYFHVAAPIICGYAALFVGAEIILISELGALDDKVITHFWENIERFKITSIGAFYLTYINILKLPVFAKLNSLRHVLVGASLAENLYNQLYAITGVVPQEIYGLPEAGNIASSNLLNNILHRGSMGIPYPYTQIKTVKLTAENHFLRDCLPNEIGSICLKGPGISKSYFPTNLNEGKFLQDGWLITSDFGYQDSHGYFYYSGHKSTIITTENGEYISTFDAESFLLENKDIRQAVIAWKNCTDSQALVAYISLYPGKEVDIQNLMKLLSKNGVHLSDIIILDELPTIGTGKVDLRQLQ